MAPRPEIHGPDERPGTLMRERQLPGERLRDAGSEIAHVRADLDRARAQVLDGVESLEQSLRAMIDWRARVRARPAPYLAGAFCLGYAIGRLW